MAVVSGVLEDRLNQATRMLAQARQRLAQAQARLQQLQSFRDDYGQHHAGTNAGTVSAFQLQDFNAFVSRLDAAITQQGLQIRGIEKDVADSERHWQHQRSRSEAVNKLLETYQAAGRQQEEQADQQQTDDYAVQRYVSDKDRS